ncbi:MAG: Mur ligase [Micavibrio sp.]|nr:MAG: Mur ligase [Micavibrio sp.]
MIETAITALTYIGFLAFAARRLLTYLHIFQQEEYDENRFLKWVFAKKVFDKRLSLVLILAGSLSIAERWIEIPQFIPAAFVFLGFIVTVAREKDPRFQSKKKLAMTTRAKRIFFTALAYAALSGAWVFLITEPFLWLIPVQLMPLILVLGNMTMSPIESALQKKYWGEASRKLAQVKPIVIGVTGSYGKTSVKHILGHILKAAAPTLVTPGSVNTVMGISRIIREDLEDDHKYFIVEMGAYGPGSIKRLCALTPPNIGIISAVGHAHLERFKSLDIVAQTKYELAEAVIASGGKMIVQDKTLNFPHPQELRGANPSSFMTSGDDESNYLAIKEAKQTDKGLEMTIYYNKTMFVLDAPLFGLHHAQNVALAFAAARALDIPADTIATALKRTPQIPHRLEMKKQAGGGAIIDDAFNSNPLGFRSALDLLAVMDPSKRKILITPGIVELGSSHDDVHEKLGLYAGEVCDVAIVVNGGRIPTFIKGYKEKSGGKPLHEMKTFAEAQDWIQKNKQDSDVILIENDLPDLYESVPKL